MSTQTATISYNEQTDHAVGVGPFVHLEQIGGNNANQTATMYDIQQMVARAKSGVSARTYKVSDCLANLVGTTLVVDFQFTAWPSTSGLSFEIDVSGGILGRPVLVDQSTTFSVTFEQSDVVELDFALSRLDSAAWETECYDIRGNVVDVGEVTLDGENTLRIDTPCFGVCRIRASKVGYKYALVVVLDNVDMKITNLNVAVVASWYEGDEKKTESITMEVPQCIKDLLESCWVDTDGDGIPDTPGDGSIFNICPNEPTSKNVYISSCSWETLLVVELKLDDQGWCG